MVSLPDGQLELWGGLECTVNRVGDRYVDQLSRYTPRLDDLDQLAALGIRRLRYPVLWERVELSADPEAEWRRVEEQLLKLVELGIEPIVGLVHHGSGPPHTC